MGCSQLSTGLKTRLIRGTKQSIHLSAVKRTQRQMCLLLMLQRVSRNWRQACLETCKLR